MLEPEHNPNPSIMVDPPALVRRLIKTIMDQQISPAKVKARRDKAEAKRLKSGAAHEVEYFHQLDDPYSHLTAQILKTFAERYDVEVKPHLIRAAGGKDQPELEKLANWARRDAQLIAPHYGLAFPATAPTVPDSALLTKAARHLAKLSPADFIETIAPISTALWSGDLGTQPLEPSASERNAEAAISAGSARMQDLKHYSGACFYYAGEWYWGVDRLFHLEMRLRSLGLQKTSDAAFIAPRPEIDVSDVDASALTLDFYPSLNSPYTSIIYAKTIEMKNACGVGFNHKPVLPMIMRGVPASNSKGRYILFDTKREAEFLGVPFGPFWTPIGTPVRRAYSLMPWAKEQGKDEALLQSLLSCAFWRGIPLHKTSGIKIAVEEAGLDWAEASKIIGNDAWRPIVESYQDEMVDGLGLWGVPSYRLSGPGNEPDLAVWGQDRLWLIAAEIQRRAT